ncbi:hypothetical protein GAMM_100125 [Gammaproteobacteria bacterium]
MGASYKNQTAAIGNNYSDIKDVFFVESNVIELIAGGKILKTF